MKKIIITSVFFLIGIIFLSGCGQQQSLEQNIINKENDKVLSQNEELKNENQIIEKKKNWVEEETLLYTIPSDHNIMKGGPAGYSCPSIYFSTDGKRFAYGGWRMNKDLNKSTGPFSIIDGKENNPVENIKEYFKNNYDIGNKIKLNYTKQGTTYVLLANGKRVAESDKVINGAMSKDGKQLIYTVTDATSGVREIVVNGVKSNEKYTMVGPQSCDGDGNIQWPCDEYAFAYDGKQNAYFARKGALYTMVVNGKEREQYEEMFSPMFSFDSKHSAYKGCDSGKCFAVVDGEKGKSYDAIYNLHFTNDGNLTFDALDGSNIVLVTETYVPQDDAIEQNNNSSQGNTSGTVSLSDLQNYKNEKNGFSLSYPSDWKALQISGFDSTFFMLNTYDENKIKNQTVDKENDCIFSVNTFSSAVNFSSFCKNNNGEILLGGNRFKICAFFGIDETVMTNRYVIVNPNSSYTLMFEFNDKNASCKKKSEDILATLKF